MSRPDALPDRKDILIRACLQWPRERLSAGLGWHTIFWHLQRMSFCVGEILHESLADLPCETLC
mgnify:CR=1 FL=1